MPISIYSRHCTKACRSLQTSWSLAVRFQSNPAARHESSSNVTSSSNTDANELVPSTQADIKSRRMSRKKQLSLARAMSLYHHTSDFPDFQPERPSIQARALKTTLPRSAPRVDDYIYSKLHHEPLKPLGIERKRSTPNTRTPRHDPYAFIDSAKLKQFRLVPEKDAASSKDKGVQKKWDALSPLASRESRTRARKMMDALLGTVDARYPGLKMVKNVCDINRQSATKRQARLGE